MQAYMRIIGYHTYINQNLYESNNKYGSSMP